MASLESFFSGHKPFDRASELQIPRSGYAVLYYDGFEYIIISTSAFPLSGALQNLSRSELWVLMNAFKYLSDIQYL
ncbi:hypothetical protein IMPERIA89_230093 [Imperialibacter sp. 89]|nr:hypothetical protein IMPERIA89_230093 [Imperialibacter sp. 89]CAD5262200.1 hypothetical protein IMPERIA75_280093 [Imperialibacter sp. 75]